MKIRGADIVAKCLATVGVKKIFSLSGNQIMPIYDACIDVGIDIIHVRHEAAAVFMADAWAQLSGEIGVALLTAGPGITNGVAPLYSALCAESPVLLLSGDSPVSLDGMGAFQELDQVAVSSPLTKISIRSSKSCEIGTDLFRVIRVALSGRPGPVHLALPFDLLNDWVSDESVPSIETLERENTTLSKGSIKQVLEVLASALRPVLLTGPTLSASRAGNLRSSLQQQLCVPVICMENPRGLKDPALGDVATVLVEADMVLSVGKSIDFTLNFAKSPTFNPDCKFMVIDPEDDALERARLALGDRLIVSKRCNAVEAAKLLTTAPIHSSKETGEWLQKVAQAVAARGNDVEKSLEAGPIHPQALCSEVQRFICLSDDPVIICDGGEFGQWAQAYMSAPTRIINGISGAIGGGTCFAIAAKINKPEATVVVLMGDGTAGFHLAEFETAVRSNTPFIAVIGHDARWNAEVQIQMRDYGSDRLISCHLQETRYDLVVQGLGGYGEYVEDIRELDAALQRAQASGLPACINVKIEGLPAPVGAGH